MTNNELIIRQTLQYQNLSASTIAKATGLSQPTVSRTLKKMLVLKLGGGRSTVFALIETIEPISIYQANAEGNISIIGKLYRQPNGRTLLTSKTNHHKYDNLPFYLYDSLPTGFLGDITLKNILKHDSTLSIKSQDWSDNQILHYLTHYGYDLTGNIILSSNMAHQAAEQQHPIITQNEYSEISQSINKIPDNLGSSIAGEQPKFTVFNGNEHLIVKYSPLFSEDNPIAIRHRDLMICEHLALQTLQENGIASAKTSLLFHDRIYLEIKRFDRIGHYGRQGMVSLRSIDAEYAGKNTTWPDIAKELLSKKLISQDEFFIIEICYAFGLYIANSDMHNGNFSFFMNDLTIGTTTPVYDMLPMAFMPRQGELRNPAISLPRFINCSDSAKNKAKKIATIFWQSVMQHQKISKEFKVLTQDLHR